MGSLELHTTPLALWHKVVNEAETVCAKHLQAEIEAYLVFLLMRYANKPEVIQKACASEFLQTADLPYPNRFEALRNVGDKCLIFSGLFPGIAERRHVRISYFVTLGQAAYEAASEKKGNELFHALAEQFVVMMDILHTLRDHPRAVPMILPMQAYDLWADTGSESALKILKQYTQGGPVIFMAESHSKNKTS